MDKKTYSNLKTKYSTLSRRRRNTMKGTNMSALILIGIWLFFALGWIMNVVAITGLTFDLITPEVVLRIVGVFVTPLGGVLGYIPF